MTAIPDSDYAAAQQLYEDRWSLIDQTLYDLCAQHTDHQSRVATTAKLALIGRTYMTGIERQIPSKGTQASSLGQLAEYFDTNRTIVETIFSHLPPSNAPLTPETLQMIVVAHGMLVSFLSERMRHGKHPRSFASKYMHFHCPIVPIYDSVASRKLWRMIQWEPSFAIFELPSDGDPVYYAFVIRFWQLFQERQQAGKSVSVRILDSYLLA